VEEDFAFVRLAYYEVRQSSTALARSPQGRPLLRGGPARRQEALDATPAVTVDLTGVILSAVHEETAFLGARGLTCRRGGRTVLHGVDLDLVRGRVTALAGPSGAGKTTLLRCLVRLEEPAGGQVLLEGLDARAVDPCVLRRRVGLVAQAAVMLPGDVAANVGYGLDASTNELSRSLAAVGLPGEMLKRDAGGLSAGEAARVALARALARTPAALLLDEPTAALDASAARVVEEHVRALAAGGLAVLLVGHDSAQARRMADRAVVLDGGRVVRAGGVEAVL